MGGLYCRLPSIWLLKRGQPAASTSIVEVGFPTGLVRMGMEVALLSVHLGLGLGIFWVGLGLLSLSWRRAAGPKDVPCCGQECGKTSTGVDDASPIRADCCDLCVCVACTATLELDPMAKRIRC